MSNMNTDILALEKDMVDVLNKYGLPASVKRLLLEKFVLTFDKMALESAKKEEE